MNIPIQNRSNNEYVEKKKRCYPRVLTVFMLKLEMLNLSEDTVEVMAKKLVHPHMHLNC